MTGDYEKLLSKQREEISSLVNEQNLKQNNLIESNKSQETIKELQRQM